MRATFRRKARFCRKPISSRAARRAREIIARMRDGAAEIPGRSIGHARAELPFSEPERGADPRLHRGKGNLASPRSAATSRPCSSTGCGIGMKLQSDPTIIYGITRGYPLGRGIRESELDASRPTTPMRSPACRRRRSAIRARMRSRPCSIRRIRNDLYFVADGTGGHVFSDIIAEHEQERRQVAADRARSKDRADPFAPRFGGAMVRRTIPEFADEPRQHDRFCRSAWRARTACAGAGR